MLELNRNAAFGVPDEKINSLLELYPYKDNLNALDKWRKHPIIRQSSIASFFDHLAEQYCRACIMSKKVRLSDPKKQDICMDDPDCGQYFYLGQLKLLTDKAQSLTEEYKEYDRIKQEGKLTSAFALKKKIDKKLYICGLEIMSNISKEAKDGMAATNEINYDDEVAVEKKRAARCSRIRG